MNAAARTELFETLHTLGKEADQRAAEIEANRRLPDDIADRLKASGVLKLWTAEAYGGHQATISDLLDATETLSYYDGATGWVAMVTGTASLMSGYLAPDAAQEIYGPANAMIGGLAAPMGKAVRVEGGDRKSVV